MPKLELLTKDQLQTIHDATIEILENRGIRFQHDQALEYLRGAGAEVDRQTRIAKFSKDIVKAQLGRRRPTSYGELETRNIIKSDAFQV